MAGTWIEERVQVGQAGHLLRLRLAGPAAGDPVVVLHDAGAESVDAPAWALLAQHVDVVQVMLPGVGGSEPPPPGADLRWTTDLLRDLLHGLWQVPGVLVGTSLGGWFALETAIAHPTSVGRLVLLDTAGLHTPTAYLFGLFAAGQGHGGQDALIGPLMARHGAPAGRAASAAYVAGLTAAALSSWSAHTPDPSLQARAAGLGVPTTVLWGSHDALIPLAHGRALVRALGDAAELVVLDGGHLLAIDAPEAVASRVAPVVLPSGAACPSTTTD